MVELIRDYGAVITAVCVTIWLLLVFISLRWLILLFLGKYDIVG